MENVVAKRMNLLDRICSRENIYNAIYCMESYVFEKGLLDTDEAVKDYDGNILAKNDLELYFALNDKFNHALIGKVIELCRKRLDEIFGSEKELFYITVYFKLKSYEDGLLKFRPMHTARLTDLICMVCILVCLMYDDSDKRHLSDLAKLIPHNFYGNVPSTDVEFLFKRWQTQYKEYTQSVIEHCRAYKNNHRFLTEVSLDIKNFFPSVSPLFLYDYINKKLSTTYRSEEDKATLEKAVAKLLFFNVREENVEPWKETYYGKTDIKPLDNGAYMNCGIPQGLPQSYFFGNLCMIEVKKVLMKEDIFKGDAYFYVDDSVIYVKSEMKDDDFANRIGALNDIMKKYCGGWSKIKESEILYKEYVDFHKKIPYTIEFHEDGKSSYCHIDDADNHMDGEQNIYRQVSKNSSLYDNMDDIDDSISLEKLTAINAVVTNEIRRLKDTLSGGSNNKDCKKETARLKMLQRFKKFYLYRIRRLKMKTDKGPTDAVVDDFRKRFLIKNVDLESWFELNEDEIFKSEYRLLIQQLSKKSAEIFGSEIKNFELSVFLDNTKSCADPSFLYYSKDVHNSIRMKGCGTDKYSSLKHWTKENFRGLEGLQQEVQLQKFKDYVFSETDDSNFLSHITKGLWNEGYSSFVANNSSEYQRMLLNAYYSNIVGVECSDDYSFIKKHGKRRLHYTEVRILMRLRNRIFDLDDFKAFLRSLCDENIANEMFIDMALLSVVGAFVRWVRNPDWVDDLIQTHRVTKGLWYNGSKFLNSYTLHNEEHAVTLILQSVHIVKTIDYLEIKQIDYYILFLACYLHDISMVIHPDMYQFGGPKKNDVDFISEQMLNMRNAVDKFFKVKKNAKRNANIKEAGNFLVDVFSAVYSYFENEVRSKHPSDSANFVVSKSNTLLGYIEPAILSFVAKVSASHGWDSVDVYGLKSRAKNDTVSLKYLMIVLRLADLFDVANDRVNYHLLRQNIETMPIESKFHWISHLVTDKLNLNAEYEVLEDLGISEKPIKETLIVDMFLNVKYLTSCDNVNPCKGCKCSFAETDNQYIDIDIVGNSSGASDECDMRNCTLLSRWMMEKHKYLLPELMALNEYLFSVNNSLVRTDIKVRINYKDDMKLDADLFDNVVEYLKW